MLHISTLSIIYSIMRPLLLLLLVFRLSVALAQEKPLVLPGKLLFPQMDIGAYTTFYEDRSGDTLPLSVIRQQRFRPFAEKRNERATFSDRSMMVTWLRFAIRNSHPTDTLRLFHDVWAHMETITYEDDRLISRGGIPSPVSRSDQEQQRGSTRFKTGLTIPPLRQQTYYVRVIDYVLSATPILSTLYSPQASLQDVYKGVSGDYPLVVVMALLLGCLLFMSLYALYSFFLTRDRAFLYYAFYTITSSLIVFHGMDMRFGLGWLCPYYPILNLYFPGPLHPGLITVFYGLFIINVLGIRLVPVHWYAVVKILFGVLLLQEGMALVESFVGKPLFADNTIYRYGVVPSGLTTLVLMGVVFRSNSSIRGYLLVGMSSLLSLTLVSVLFNPNPVDLPPSVGLFALFVPFWMALGLSIEAFCFALALAYRGRLIELESRRIQQRYTQDLEDQLAERTREIEQQSRLLETQHIRQLETEFEQKLADTEMTALRAQMNPHFIFNCLNSIKLYTLQHDADKASDYLTKFSRLIRLVLENSRSALVPLQSELEALQLYIELEAMRFKQKVSFAISVAPDIDQRYVCIPPLLIQPYVENAIWHGLMHKPQGGTVTVAVSQPQENLLHVEITDDGIGRQQAAGLKSKSAGKHKSFGMQVTADRIRMINQLYNIQTQTLVLDLVNGFGEPCGTKVILQIPV